MRQTENGSKNLQPEGLVFSDSLSVSLTCTFLVDSAHQPRFIHIVSFSIIKRMKSLILKAFDQYTADVGKHSRCEKYCRNIIAGERCIYGCVLCC